MKAPSVEETDYRCGESDTFGEPMEECPLGEKAVHSVRKIDLDSTCSDKEFLTERDGAA